MDVDAIQMREGRWFLPDLRGNGGQIRTWRFRSGSSMESMPGWSRRRSRTDACYGRFSKSGKLMGTNWANGRFGRSSSNLRRRLESSTCDTRSAPDGAKLCRKNGGYLEQIEFLLGHRSIQTTERHLGSEQQPITRCTPAQSAAPNSGTNCHHLHSRKTDDRNPNG